MYRFYIDGLLLPVTPAKLQMKIKNKNKKITLLNEGEVSLLKTAGLTEISFTALFPQSQYPFAVYENGFKKAEYYLGKLEDLKIGKKPFRFIVSRLTPSGKLLFHTNMKVSLEDYTINEDAKKLGMDVESKIKLKQYRDFGTKKLKMSDDGKTATVIDERSKKDLLDFYIVRDGDTLYEIAKKELGDGEKYHELMELNSITNPNDIATGQVIKLV